VQFLLRPEREVLYGGAAGGGKSEALLMIALQYVDVPGHAAMVFRRTYADLALPGALMDRAHEWLHDSGASWSQQEKQWTFPSGATITFGYLDGPRDHYRYQGVEVQTLCFDELTQLREEQYRYLHSRLRRSDTSEVPLRIRSASNPGGEGHDWVARRFGLGAYAKDADGSRPFIPATLDDNPYLDRESYRETLMGLDPVTRQQLLEGDWNARESGSVFRREWFGFTDAVPASAQMIRYWDRAATAARNGNDPDYTVGALVGMHEGMYYIAHVERFRGTPADNERRIQQIADTDGPKVQIRMEQEPGSSGADTIDHYARRVLAGYSFKGDRPTGPKTERAAIWASAAEQGNVWLVRGAWNTAFIDEAEAFPLGSHDDQIDAVSGAIRFLAGNSRGRIRMIS